MAAERNERSLRSSLGTTHHPLTICVSFKPSAKGAFLRAQGAFKKAYWLALSKHRCCGNERYICKWQWSTPLMRQTLH
jgi:hypothetical protein